MAGIFITGHRGMVGSAILRAYQKAGGDYEEAPSAVFEKVFTDNNFKIKAPSKSGKYRLFVVIKDGEKGATANIPFLVK